MRGRNGEACAFPALAPSRGKGEPPLPSIYRTRRFGYTLTGVGWSGLTAAYVWLQPAGAKKNRR